MKPILVMMATLTMTAASYAGQFYVLEIDEHMRSRSGNDTIKLRQQLRQQKGIVSQGMDILSVLMVAKTKHGGGNAKLLVGQSQTSPQTVDGTPSEFHSTDEVTYDRVLFKNPKQNSNGKWQLKLRGNFKVSQVVVEIGEPLEDVSLAFNLHTRTGRGGPDTLFLKREMNAQTNLSPRDYDIDSVTIVAKSKHGGGTATLKVGQSLSQPATLPGSPQQFRGGNLGTYSAITIANPKFNSNGPWQIKLRGNIKVKEVILHLKQK